MKKEKPVSKKKVSQVSLSKDIAVDFGVDPKLGQKMAEDMADKASSPTANTYAEEIKSIFPELTPEQQLRVYLYSKIPVVRYKARVEVIQQIVKGC
jgi:hypothetical protein